MSRDVQEMRQSKKEREGVKGERQERCAVAGDATYRRRVAEQRSSLTGSLAA